MNIRLEPFKNLNPQQQVEKHYLIAVESADLVNSLCASSGDRGVIQRNVDHLKIMVAKDFWDDQDVGLLNDAILTGEEYLNG